MDLKRWSHIVAVAERRSFARAAELVHLSQPALSRSIQAAEAALAMLSLRLIGPRNPRLAPIFAAAPLEERAPLLCAFIHREVPFEPVWPAVVPLLTSADPAITARFEEDLCLLPWRRLGPRYRQAAAVIAIALRTVRSIVKNESLTSVTELVDVSSGP